MRARSLVLTLLLLGIAAGGGAWRAGAQAPGPTAAIAATDGSVAGELRVVVDVLDPAGRPIPGMVPSQFQAWIQGTPAAIKLVTPASDSGLPIDVLLAIDVSGSMDGVPLDQARAAARAFIAGLAPADRAAVLSFSDSVNAIQDFTADRAALDRALNALTAGGNTALYQATVESLRRTAAGAAPRRAVILLTDGVDYGGRSDVTRDQAIMTAAAQGIPIFAIALGSEIDEGYLSALAGYSSGRYFSAPTPDALARLYDDVGTRLRTQYVLTLDTSAADLAKPLPVRIEALPGGAASAAVAETTLPALQVPPLPLAISGLAAGEEVRGERDVAVSVGDAALASVAYRLDGGPAAQPPPPFAYHLPALSAGSHRLDVEVVAADGRRATTSVQFAAVGAVAAATPSAAGQDYLMYAFPAVGGAGFGLAAWLYFRARRRARHRLLAAAAQAMERTRGDALSGESPQTPGEERNEPVPLEAEPEMPEMIEEPAEVQPEERVAASRSKLVAMWGPDQEEAPPAYPEEPLGRIVGVGGALDGRSFPVGATPLIVGAGYRCHVRLPVEATDASTEEARLWVRRGRLMYHRVARLQAVPEEYPGPEWLVIDVGEQFEVGRQAFLFELAELEEGAEQADSPAAASPKLSWEPRSELAPAVEDAVPPEATPPPSTPRWSEPAPRAPMEAPEGSGDEDLTSILRDNSSLRPGAAPADREHVLDDEEFEGEGI